MIPASKLYFRNKLKVKDENIINSVFSEGNTKEILKNPIRKKNKFENINSSLKAIQEKLKIFLNIDEDSTIKKNTEFLLNYINSISNEVDNLKKAVEELKNFYKEK